MQNFWPTAFFWIAFGVISSLVLRCFYFSKSATLARKLRLIARICIIGVFILLLFPWIPESHGGPTGWGIVLQGDMPMVVLAGLLLFTMVTLFIPRKLFLSKMGMMAHFAATIFLFGLMIYTFPGTITLKFRDSAPIFAVMIMLTNNVVLLLLWHQLQVNKR